MIESYARWVIRWRWLVIVFSVASALLMASGMQYFKIDNDYRVFFGPDNPQLVAFEELQDTYTKNDNVLIVLAPEDGQVFTKEIMAAVIDITERAWQIPFSSRVDSLTNYQHTVAVGDDLVVGDLVEDATALTEQDLEDIKQVSLKEPALIHRLVSTKADITAINVTIELPGEDMTAELPQTIDEVRKIESYIRETYPEMGVYLTGIAMMNNAFQEAAQSDAQSLVPMAFLLIIVMVYLQLRGFGGTVGTAIVILLSIMSAMGVTIASGVNITPPVMSAPTIILTLGVADCVHVLTNWMQRMRLGESKQDAMVHSLQLNMMPIFLTSVTTAIGFLTLNFSDVPPFHDLGNISAIGVLFAWIYAVLLLPALMMVLPVRIRQEVSKPSLVMERFAEWVIARHRQLVIIMSAIIIGLVALIPLNEANDIYVEYFDESIQFRTDTDFVVDNLTGMYLIDFSLNSKDDGGNGIATPVFLQQVEEFANWLREQPEVIHVNSITDVFKRVNRSMHGDDESWYKLPEARDMGAQYLLLYEMSLPYGLDLNNQIDIGKQSTRLTATLETLSTVQVLSLEKRIYDWMQQNTPAIATLGSSPTVMFSHIGMKNIKSMMTGAIVALVLISMILVFALRSWRYGLLSLIPNLAPAGMAFGIWGVIDGEIGMSISVVTAMTLGIVVDDTIHFLSKYIRARREYGESAVDSVRYAFRTVGVALWITSVALVAGFMVLMTSAFELNASMGLLVAIVIALALVADFLLLPGLLIRFDRWLNPEQAEDSEKTKMELHIEATKA